MMKTPPAGKESGMTGGGGEGEGGGEEGGGEGEGERGKKEVLFIVALADNSER